MIKVNFKCTGFSAELLNGTINVPDEFGGYIISTGCGSGKTCAIKEIIRHKYNDGILYVVDTKAEANKMYNWILDNTDLKEDNVALIHNDNEVELFSYYQDPSFVIRKKVLILTHVRFWTDLINYFVVYNETEKLDVFDGDFFKLMQREDLRKYIIFDETPQFFKPFATFSNEVLRNYKITKESGMLANYFGNDIHSWFDAYYKEGSEDFPQSTMLQRVRRNCSISCIPIYYNWWSSMKSTDQKEKKHKLYFYPKDLIQSGMRTKVMIFEGAGDILFQHQLEYSKSFQLIDIENKYNGTVEFNKINHTQKRSDIDYIKSSEFQKYLNDVAEVIKNNNKTLIVVWKDLLDSDSNGKKIALEDYAKWFKNTISQRPDVDPSKFEVIYYGASNTKSTNEFMDYDCIILSGNWNVWNKQSEEEKNKFTDAYLIKTNEYFCKLWYFVQLITRIGIRKHDGKKYSVYYSSSFESEFISDLYRYFNKNQLKVSSDHKVLTSFETKLNSIKGLHTTTVEAIKKLNNDYDPGIEAAIIDGKERIVNISLDTLYNMFPVSRKMKSRYNKLVETLKKVGILLVII
jgi:hypothetical protein